MAALLLAGRAAAAQGRDPHDAQPERPTVATHAGTVAPRWVEIETGAELDSFPDGTRGGSANILTKIGLASRVQLDLLASAVKPTESGPLGAGDFAVGIKWRLADAAPLLGRFAVQPSLKLPTGAQSVGRGTGTTDIGLLLISSHSIRGVSIDVNAGVTRRSGDGSVAPKAASLWTVSTGGPVTERVGWVAEVFGYPGTSGPAGQPNAVALLAGPTFEWRRSVVFDAGGIIRLAGEQPHALYAGAVWNVGRLGR